LTLVDSPSILEHPVGLLPRYGTGIPFTPNHRAAMTSFLVGMALPALGLGGWWYSMDQQRRARLVKQERLQEEQRLLEKAFRRWDQDLREVIEDERRR
jgi:hypothetical protein